MHQCFACGTCKRIALHHLDYPGPWGDLCNRADWAMSPTTCSCLSASAAGSGRAVTTTCTESRGTIRTCALQRLRSWRQDDKLAAQLGSIKWGVDSRGRIKIESKDDMRKRGLPSPDRADAMAIAFAGKANAAPMNVESHAGESITGI